MQTFFSNIENTLYDWFLLISNNSLYSAILAAVIGIILSSVIVGLIMSARCRAKNAKLNMSLSDMETKGGQGDVAFAEDLGEAKQLIQKLKVELNDKDRLVGQMEKDMQNIQVQTEYTSDLEEHIHHRNEQISQIVDSLETDFDLGESRELPSVDDVWAEALWNRHNQLMTHLQSRLPANALLQNKQTEGQSLEDVAKKEAIIAELTQTLETQSIHITKLEHDLAAQKKTMQESLLKAQEHSAEIEEKTLARITELEAVETINSHVIEPAMNTYHTFSENFTELPEISMQVLQRQSEGLKKLLLGMKEQFDDSATISEAVAAVKNRINHSATQQSTAGA